VEGHRRSEETKEDERFFHNMEVEQAGHRNSAVEQVECDREKIKKKWAAVFLACVKTGKGRTRKGRLFMTLSEIRGATLQKKPP